MPENRIRRTGFVADVSEGSKSLNGVFLSTQNIQNIKSSISVILSLFITAFCPNTRLKCSELIHRVNQKTNLNLSINQCLNSLSSRLLSFRINNQSSLTVIKRKYDYGSIKF